MISIVVLFSIAVDIVRFISLTIPVSPGNPRLSVSHQTNDCNNNIDKIVHKTTTGEGGIKLPCWERNKNDLHTD